MLSHHPNLSFLLFLLRFLHQSVAATTAVQRCHVDDETGLLAFKSGIKSDPSGILSSWQPGTDCCTTWSGVYCSPGGSRVTRLSLRGESSDPRNNILSGRVSPSLAKLHYLAALIFWDLRNITGPFPDFLLALPGITIIAIRNTKLSGRLPAQMGNMATLETLDLTGNQFSGGLPTSLANLTRLTELNLSNNRLSGVIPGSLRLLRNLGTLDLSGNRLGGSIPDIFSAFPFLKFVYLSNNNFSGNIPKSFASLRSMAIDLRNNALTGQIPHVPGSRWLNSTVTLILAWNQLSGTVPKSFGDFKKISTIDVSHNKLNGSFPQIRSKNYIWTLDLSYNDYNFKTIPGWISNTSMETLKLAKCGIKMKLNDWKPTASFVNIDLSENELTGSPLQLLENQTRLAGLWSAGNKLKFDMEQLKTGKKLKYLDLSNNLAFGKVPKTVSRLQELNVSHNHLCGPLPPTAFPASAFLGNDCLCGPPLPPCKA